MVGSNGTMIAIRLVRSKLRKREEHQQQQQHHHHHHHHHHQHGNAVHPEIQVQQQRCARAALSLDEGVAPRRCLANAPVGGIVNPALSVSTTTLDSCCQQQQQQHRSLVNGDARAAAERTEERTTTSTVQESTILYTSGASANGDQFVWQFPPPYPPPNVPPPQYTLYNDQDTLVHGLQSDRQGFAKGFRKNLGGRWRRLVKRKPETEQCAIPPELKDQLKTIYVY